MNVDLHLATKDLHRLQTLVSQYLFITLELEVLLIAKLHTVALPCLYFFL